MKLPKTITLRLTKTALDAVPDCANTFLSDDKKDYNNMHQCLICKSIRERFPDVQSICVFPGSVYIDHQYTFEYSPDHEKQIRRAHRFPRKFKPFSIKLTRV